MIAISYILPPEGEITKERSDAIAKFIYANLPRDVTELQTNADAVEWISAPLPERPLGGKLASKITQTRAKHLILARLDELFTHASTAVDALAILTQCVDHVWVMQMPAIHFIKGDQTSDLLRTLRSLDTTIVDADRLRRKALSQSRRKGPGRPRGTRALYGFQIVKDKKGDSHLVPDEQERQVMAWIVEQRDIHQATWEEVTSEARRLRIKNRHGGPISQLGLIRRYNAAQKLFAEESKKVAVNEPAPC